MGKIKSAIFLTLITILIAALCFVCTVSFSYGTDNMYTFNSVLRMTAKDADLGGSYGSDGYRGGGYSAVYYPEGVISAKEFQDNLGGIADESERKEYEESYVSYANGNLYLDKELVCNGKTEPSEEFAVKFENTYEILTERYSALKKDGVRLELQDNYTVRVFLPKDVVNSSLYALVVNAYTGTLSVRYGSDSDSATTIMPAYARYTITDYIKSVSSRTAADGTAYVMLNLTSKGREIVAAQTETANTMYFMIGEDSIISLTVSEQIDQTTLYISGSYTSETASVCAAVLNTALKTSDTVETLSLNVGDSYEYTALYGSNALMSLYIAFGVMFLAMMIFFFVRYRRLGFVHLYTYLIFALAMILCVWSISFLYLSVEAFIAFMLVSLLLSVSNVITFEYAKKEYASGKTMASSVKTGYKKCLLHLIDLHVVIAVLSFITFGIGLANLSVFAFVLGLGTVFSGICTLAINRFLWAIMMAFTPNKGRFCNFTREEVEDDD